MVFMKSLDFGFNIEIISNCRYTHFNFSKIFNEPY